MFPILQIGELRIPMYALMIAIGGIFFLFVNTYKLNYKILLNLINFTKNMMMFYLF